MSYTDNTIVISNLMTAGAIHVHTRYPLTDAQLSALQDIRGVASFKTGGKGLTPSLKFYAGFPRNYTTSINTGQAFSFEELAPQIILVFVDALGLDIDTVDVRIDKNFSSLDSSWLITAARILRKKPVPRNPIAPFVATLDDVKPGVHLLTVGYSRFNVVKQYIATCEPDRVKRTCGGLRLGDMGILPYDEKLGIWNGFYLTIVNTVENRRKLVTWLLLNRNQNVAKNILELYPSDYTVKVTVSGREVVATVS